MYEYELIQKTFVEFCEHKLQSNESWNRAQGNNLNYILWFDIFENMVH